MTDPTPQSPQQQPQQLPPQYMQYPQHAYAMPDPDEINLLEYVYVLVKAKWWIIGATALGLIAGYIAALIKGPTYVAEAVIAAKESPSSQKTPNLSGLGMFGGIVASQLNIGGNPGLDKIDVILDSKKFYAEMAEKYYLYPFLFPKIWDPIANKWAMGVEPPKPLNVGGFIKGKFLEKEMNKNGTMTIKIQTPDSALTDTLISACLTYLDTYIKTTVQTDAKENKDYLEEQLISVTDPLLRGKIQELIAGELEKIMVVSKEAFTVIDPNYVSKSFIEKKMFPAIFAAALFFLSILLFIFTHSILSSNPSIEDRDLLTRIRTEAFRLPIKK